MLTLLTSQVTLVMNGSSPGKVMSFIVLISPFLLSFPYSFLFNFFPYFFLFFLPLLPFPSISLSFPVSLSPLYSLSSLSLPLSLFSISRPPSFPPYLSSHSFHTLGLPYRPNISPLMVDVSSETDNRLHIKIYDPNFERWEVPTR